MVDQYWYPTTINNVSLEGINVLPDDRQHSASATCWPIRCRCLCRYMLPNSNRHLQVKVTGSYHILHRKRIRGMLTCPWCRTNESWYAHQKPLVSPNLRFSKGVNPLEPWDGSHFWRVTPFFYESRFTHICSYLQVKSKHSYCKSRHD